MNDKEYKQSFLEKTYNDFVELYYGIDSVQNDELEYTTKMADLRIVASVIKEIAESVCKECDTVLKDKVNEKTTWNYNDYDKKLELSIKKNSVIDSSIVKELSDAECRKGFTVTQKAIELAGRKDLIEKYKSIVESKAITLKSLKD